MSTVLPFYYEIKASCLYQQPIKAVSLHLERWSALGHYATPSIGNLLRSYRFSIDRLKPVNSLLHLLAPSCGYKCLLIDSPLHDHNISPLTCHPWLHHQSTGYPQRSKFLFDRHPQRSQVFSFDRHPPRPEPSFDRHPQRSQIFTFDRQPATVRMSVWSAPATIISIFLLPAPATVTHHPWPATRHGHFCSNPKHSNHVFFSVLTMCSTRPFGLLSVFHLLFPSRCNTTVLLMNRYETMTSSPRDVVFTHTPKHVDICYLAQNTTIHLWSSIITSSIKTKTKKTFGTAGTYLPLWSHPRRQM